MKGVPRMLIEIYVGNIIWYDLFDTIISTKIAYQTIYANRSSRTEKNQINIRQLIHSALLAVNFTPTKRVYA